MMINELQVLKVRVVSFFRVSLLLGGFFGSLGHLSGGGVLFES